LQGLIPVPSLEDVDIYWVKVRRPEAVLHGYLLYAGSDHCFPEYMSNEGMGDLDSWTRRECGIFVFQSPPEGWIKHALQTDNAWAKLVRDRYGAGAADEIIAAGSSAVIEFDGRKTTIKQIFAGCTDFYIRGDLIQRVLAMFKLPPTQHPHLILFRDLRSAQFWHASLESLVNVPEGELRKALQKFFERADFAKLVREARRAKG
jgi:hypothetical protein